MDFWTATAYIGILILVLANALVVRRMKVTIRNHKDDKS